MLQKEGHNGMDNRLRNRADPIFSSMPIYQQTKDSSELLNSEKDFRESRPDEEVPQANAT